MMKRKLAAGIMTAVMTLALCLGTGAPVLAAGEPGAPEEDAKGAVKKELVMDENVTAPAATFKFEIEKATENVTDATGKDVTDLLATDGPELAIGDIAITQGADGTVSESVKTVSGEARITKADGGELDASYFKHTGVFAYNITETGNTYTIEDATKEKMTYSKAEYTIFISVANKEDGGLFIESIQGMIKVDDAGTDVPDEKVESTEPGTTDLAFRNIYSKTGGTGEEGNEWDPDLGALSISKNVTGKYGDQTKEFKFTLSLYKNATLDMEVAQSEDKTYPTYTVTMPNQDKLEYQFDAETEVITHSFVLKHGEKLTFTDVPVGTKFTLSENDGNKITNYITTISGKSDDEAFRESAMTISNKLVGEGKNYADTENNYNDNPITGIVVKNLPFVILIGAAVVGLAAYVVVKRRRFVK